MLLVSQKYSLSFKLFHHSAECHKDSGNVAEVKHAHHELRTSERPVSRPSRYGRPERVQGCYRNIETGAYPRFISRRRGRFLCADKTGACPFRYRRGAGVFRRSCCWGWVCHCCWRLSLPEDLRCHASCPRTQPTQT